VGLPSHSRFPITGPALRLVSFDFAEHVATQHPFSFEGANAMRGPFPVPSRSLAATVLLLALGAVRADAQQRYYRPSQDQTPLPMAPAAYGEPYYQESGDEFGDAHDHRAHAVSNYVHYYDDDPSAPAEGHADEEPMSRPDPLPSHDDGYDWVSDDGLYSDSCAGCGSDSCAGDCYGECYGDGCCSSGGCGMGGCDDCGGGYCSRTETVCYTNYGLAVGVEATYLRPTTDDSLDFTVSDSYDYEAAPRIWLGWQGETGWGLRGRYWNFDAEKSLSQVVDFGGLIAVQSLNQQLELYAADLEVTRAFRVGQTSCLAGFGARQGRLRENLKQHFTVFDLTGGGGDDASVILQDVDRQLEGTGLTFALGMRRPILQSRLAAVCNLRGSVIWGQSNLNLGGTVIETVPVGAGDLDLNDFDSFTSTGSDDAHMWIGELQAGAEWSVPISKCYGGGQAFVQVLVEAQWWNLPGASAAGMFPVVTDDQIFEFLGVTAAAGFAR